MLYDYLAEFATVGRLNSLTRASHQLSISQSSLSRHMDALEVDLGTTLMQRTSHGIALTQSGRFIFKKASELLDIGDSIMETLNVIRDTVSLRVYSDLDDPLLIQRIDECCKGIYSSVNKILPEYTSGFHDTSVIGMIEDGLMDIYLTLAADSTVSDLTPIFSIQAIGTSQAVAVFNSDHQYASRSILRKEDLRNFKILHSESVYYGARAGWDEIRYMFGKSGITLAPQIATVRNTTDWYMLNFNQDILVIPQSVEIVRYFSSIGKAVIPIEDAVFRYIAVYRRDNCIAKQVVASLKKV